jgi:hypothetical protein
MHLQSALMSFKRNGPHAENPWGPLRGPLEREKSVAAVGSRFSQILILNDFRAGDRTRAGDVQLGKPDVRTEPDCFSLYSSLSRRLVNLPF